MSLTTFSEFISSRWGNHYTSNQFEKYLATLTIVELEDERKKVETILDSEGSHETLRQMKPSWSENIGYMSYYYKDELELRETLQKIKEFEKKSRCRCEK